MRRAFIDLTLIGIGVVAGSLVAAYAVAHLVAEMLEAARPT